jgi:hypothetical protein
MVGMAKAAMAKAAMAKAAMASIAATCNGENGEHAASDGGDGEGEDGDGEQAERSRDGEGEHRHAAWRGGNTRPRRPPIAAAALATAWRGDAGHSPRCT